MAEPLDKHEMANPHTLSNGTPTSSRRSSTTSKGQCETPASSVPSPALHPSDVVKNTAVTQDSSIEANGENTKYVEGDKVNNLQELHHENVFGEPLRRIDNLHALVFAVVFIMFKDIYAALLTLGVACLFVMLFIRDMSVTIMPDDLVTAYKAQADAQEVSKMTSTPDVIVSAISDDVTNPLHTEFSGIHAWDDTPKPKDKHGNATKVIQGLKIELRSKDEELQAKDRRILSQEKVIGLKENRIKAKESRLQSNKLAASSQAQKIEQLEAELSLKNNTIEQIEKVLHAAACKPTEDNLELWSFMETSKGARAPRKNLDQLIPDIFQNLASLRPEYMEHTDVSLGAAFTKMLAQVVYTVEADGQDPRAPIPVQIMENVLAKYVHNKPWNEIIDECVTKVRFQKSTDFQTLGQYREEYLNAQQYEVFATLPTPNNGSQATKAGYNKGLSILDSRYLWIETNIKHLYVGLVEDYVDESDPSKGCKWYGVWALWTGTAYKVFVWVSDLQLWHCETDEISFCIEDDAVKVLKGKINDPENPLVGPRVWTCSETGPFWDRVSLECYQQWLSEQTRQQKEYEEKKLREHFSYIQNMYHAQEQAQDDMMGRNVDNLVDDEDFF